MEAQRSIAVVNGRRYYVYHGPESGEIIGGRRRIVWIPTFYLHDDSRDMVGIFETRREMMAALEEVTRV